jgi:formylmethanofuran dehydrogenase subunit C
MNPLTIRLPQTGPKNVNLNGIVPNQLHELSISEIAQLAIEVNDRPALLGDHCQVIDGDRDELAFEGDLSRCDYIGGGLTAGRITVESNVGDFLAGRMSGGRIEVRGSAGRFAGSGLRGGTVDISGDCGEYAAAATPGAERGMNGGVLVIRGNCDQWLATRMRRGTVVVHGRTAAACASRMIAGTLVLCGPVEFPLAANMARGTILMLGPRVVCNAPSGFTDPENTELSFLRILMNDIAPHLPTSLRTAPLPATVFRSLGDCITSGLGEVIWLNARLDKETTTVAHV